MARLSSNFASFDDMLRPLIGVFGVVFTLIAAIVTAMGGQPSDDPGSSRSDGYVAPDFNDAVNLELIRSDFLYGVNEVRKDENDPAVQPVVPGIELQNKAQRHAEGNAQTGQFAPLPGDVAMMQASIPEEQANSHTLMQLFLDDKPNSDLMVSPDHLRMGVGVAQGRGRVWVVVAFSRQ